jgi:hypothetical protein
LGFGKKSSRNQAPVTKEGRIIVVAAGLLSLILFGVVLGLCGYVTTVIFDDAVSRLNCGAKLILGNPMVGMLIWGTIWLFYALSLAQDFHYWWEARLPEYAAGIDRGDELWFAFISTSTIGLGDFYLQPEIIFSSDAMKYSVLFMIGFVFLSTFFGKIVETLSWLLPKQHNSLEQRLARTRVLACWPQGWMPWEKPPSEAIEAEQKVGNRQVDPDDEALVYRIEQVKELKPDPPVEDGDDEQRRGIVSTWTGKAIHCMNVELLEEEASLLREWLAVVEHQKERALAARSSSELSSSANNEDGGENEHEGNKTGNNTDNSCQEEVEVKKDDDEEETVPKDESA